MIKDLSTGNSNNPKRDLERLGKIKKELIPLDVEPLKKIIEKGKVCIEKVRGKNIIMLYGGTGCGKSLFIQFLAGSKIERRDVGDLHHFDVVAFPDNCDPELFEVISSPHAESCTSNVRGVNISI